MYRRIYKQFKKEPRKSCENCKCDRDIDDVCWKDETLVKINKLDKFDFFENRECHNYTYLARKVIYGELLNRDAKIINEDLMYGGVEVPDLTEQIFFLDVYHYIKEVELKEDYGRLLGSKKYQEYLDENPEILKQFDSTVKNILLRLGLITRY